MDLKMTSNDTKATFPLIDESIENVDITTQQYIFKHYFWQAILLTVGSFILTGLLVLFAWDILEEVALLPSIVPFVAYYFLRDRIQGIFMKQFAQANGFHYQRYGSYQISEEGSIFNRGRNKRIFNLVEGRFLQYPLCLFNYQYTISEQFGRRSQDFSYTVFKLVFPTFLPKIYLDAHQRLWDKVSGWRIKNLKRISTESNEFNKNFSLWVEEGQHLKALQIFSPDLMDELLRLPRKFDLELVANQIYIYEDGIVRTKKELLEMFQLAKHLIENIGYVLSTMK